MYNDVFKELQYYMLDEENIRKSLKSKLNFNDSNFTARTENKKENKIPLPKVENKKDTNSIFIPNQKDSLFWCFFILKNGMTKYELLFDKTTLLSKQMKIEYVEYIRKHKDVIKTYKFDTISNIESNLANDEYLNPKTFLTLCAIENFNVIFIINKTYYELLMNDSNEIFIITSISNNNLKYNNIKYGYELGDDTKISNIKSTLYKLDNISKPIKAFSAYKTQDLIDICNKLAIETIDKANGKHKNKKEMYEAIIQYF